MYNIATTHAENLDNNVSKLYILPAFENVLLTRLRKIKEICDEEFIREFRKSTEIDLAEKFEMEDIEYNFEVLKERVLEKFREETNKLVKKG